MTHCSCRLLGRITIGKPFDVVSRLDKLVLVDLLLFIVPGVWMQGCKARHWGWFITLTRATKPIEFS